MSIKCSVFIATSLDGFIARTNGELDWLPGSDGTVGDEDYGYSDFFDAIDAVVIGRKTHALATSFPEWPYQGKRVVMLSSSHPRESITLEHDVEGTSLSPAEVLQKLANEGAENIYIDGAQTIQSFLEAGLIHEMTITTIPVLIGSGIALFGPLSRDVKLHHMATTSYSNGLVQSRYKVIA